MHSPKYIAPPPSDQISHEQIEQGIARARHLRARAYGDYFSMLNRKIAAIVAARRPKLSPLEPRGI